MDYGVTWSLLDEADPAQPVRMNGTDFAALTMGIPEQPGSLLVEYRRVD